jgi:hypothetical protein
MMPWLPLAVIVGALVCGLAADRLAARRSQDRGTYWTQVLLIALATLTLLLFAGWLLQALTEGLWNQGVHLMRDLTRPDDPGAHRLAFALPLVIWVATLVGVAVMPVAAPAQGRWLAGSIGMDPSRRWVLLIAALPLTLLAGFAGFAALRIPHPDPGVDYPAALWSLLAVTIVNLVFIAFSKGRPVSTPGSELATTPTPTPATHALPSWPEALRRQGLGVETLYAYPADGSTAKAGTQTPDSCGLVRPELAERRIPAVLLETIVLGSGNRLVMAPDDCGQLESIALHAEHQITRGNAVALIVVPGEVESLRAGLLRWLPDAASVTPLDTDTPADTPAFVWLTDAKTLSDRLIPLLEKNPELLGRIGSVIWWDLHRYSGVLAANFWAISHRFQRLLDRRARNDIRHLAFVRGAPRPEVQLTAFVDLFLPRKFTPQMQTVIGDGFARATTIYLLSGGNASAADGRTKPSPDIALAATRASCAAGWPTHLATPAHLDAQVIERFRHERVDGAPLSERLASDPVVAGARILEIDAENVLALPEIIAQTGRAGPAEPMLHIGLVPAFGNPYVDSLLERLRTNPQLLSQRKRRLVAAEPQPGVIQRHLLLALNELPATLSDLKQTFRWEKTGEIAKTLRELARKNEIQRRDVRALVTAQREDRLRVEVEYRSVLSRERAPPLTTIGSRLVDVFSPGEGSIMRVDLERVTIDAYPFRVFLNGGRRYRIGQWTALAAITHGDGTLRVDCQPEDDPVKTWRTFSPHLTDTRRLDGSTDVDLVGRGLTRTLVSTVYAEHVNGYREYIQDDQTGHWTLRGSMKLPSMIHSAPLTTSGLLLNIPQEAVAKYPLGLHSLAQALRQVFPVHVGVAEDAVAILAVKGKELAGRPVWGLVIVDLYPGGIGLTQSIDEAPALLVGLLEMTRDWLANCPCQTDSGCERCMQSPMALSAVADNITLRLSRAEALGVLEPMLRR